MLQVLGGMRRHGVLELLLLLPDGSKSLVPAAWTDTDHSAVHGEQSMATLGSLSDLLQTCELVADLAGRELREQGQAAGKSPCKEDSRAACPAQSDSRPIPGATDPGQRRCRTRGVAAATALLAGVIAKAAVPAGIERPPTKTQGQRPRSCDARRWSMSASPPSRRSSAIGSPPPASTTSSRGPSGWAGRALRCG